MDMEPDADDEDVFRDMSFEDVLEELNARFLANLPEEEMSLVRVYWQAEQAHWFYEDYLRPLNPLLPTYSQRTFTHLIVASSPLFAALHGGSEGIDYDAVWDEYCRYKRMVPCCGGILINAKGDKVLMVRGWKSNAGWCFPRGKINSEESEVACAIREVKEETGFDLTGLINERDVMQTQINAQTVTMFIVGGIDEDTAFLTETRNEIGAIEWVRLVDLPTWTGKKGGKTATKGKRFYNVTPFVGPLKRWLQERGINPYPRTKKSSAPPTTQPEPSTAYRNLQPYAFEQHVQSQSTHPARSSTATALDHLFNRFVHKQEAELDRPENEAVTGADERGGLERLFGNLNVLKVEEEEGRKRQEEDEDEALASLLGGPPPAKAPPSSIPTTEKAAKLLDILQSASPALSNPSPDQSPSQQNLKPHQSSLLAVLSPSSIAAGVNIPVKPMSLPTSPRPPSPAQEHERVRKQRALLEQITAGMGIDVPSTHLPQPSAIMMPIHGNLPFSPPRSTGLPSNSPRQAYHSRHTSPQRNAFPPPAPPPNALPVIIPGWSMPPPPPYEPTPPRPPPSDQQRALLSALYTNNAAPRPPMHVYRPAPQGYSHPLPQHPHQHQPPVYPPFPSQPMYASAPAPAPNMPFGPRPPAQHHSQQLPMIPPPSQYSAPPQNNVYLPPPPPPSTFHQGQPHVYAQGGQHQQALLAQLHQGQAGQGQGRSPPKTVGGQGLGAGMGYHHPIPRSAGGQVGGVLGGMIDGRRGA
ncbi:Dcp2, box A domain-domain-containing protein [Naematelia encephala]|uniref:Dcp2, box A domain-domain-containing protein n=1 Tax=Naematelia encephala TaxID=71784 RepID=A0A1Y2AD91_9TREE|nr:Dcp2, box A domain-domain-containing protein [Naematelia encephala]